MTIRLFLIDDHPLIIDGLQLNFDRYAGLEVVGRSSNPSEALEEVSARRNEIDLVLMDVSMPGMSGIEVCRHIKQGGERPFVIFLTYLADEYLRAQLKLIPHDGVFSKTSPIDELVDYIRSVASGLNRPALGLESLEREKESEPTLSRSELIVVYYIAVKGLTSREIGELLGRSEQTIIKHRKNVMFKLGLHNIQGLVWYAIAKDLHVNPPV
jgi:two-component system nitrate/nitrite response regulator NarL